MLLGQEELAAEEQHAYITALLRPLIQQVCPHVLLPAQEMITQQAGGMPVEILSYPQYLAECAGSFGRSILRYCKLMLASAHHLS